MGSTLIIMARPHRGVLGQLEQDLSQAVKQSFCTARLKVSAAATTYQQCVAREHMPTFVGSHIKTHAACCMARRVQCLERKCAKLNQLTIDQLHRGCANVAALRRCRFQTQMLSQQTCAGNVICMRMGF